MFGSGPIEGAFGDDLGGQNLLVLDTGDFITFRKTTSTKDFASVIPSDDGLTIAFSSLLLNDKRLIGNLLVIFN